MRNFEDKCNHAEHEYVGSLKHGIDNYSNTGNEPCDIYFTDSTGGHSPEYHGCCIRYGNESHEYLSYAEAQQWQGKPVLWMIYCDWCEWRGYEAQSYEWIIRKTKHL